MNLQRREEIRALSASLRMMPLNEAASAIDELLAHIDTLEQTAAERVIARGAAVKPHTFAEIVNQVRDIANQYAGTKQLRERIAYALTPHFERNGGPTPDYTGEGSAWVPPVEAPAVAVNRDCGSCGSYQDRGGDATRCDGCGDDEMPNWNPSRALASVRAIPADCVLGEGNQFGVGFVEACGMLAAKPFDRPTLAAGLIREGGMIAALAETPSDGPGISILREEMRADLDALRANQGGM